MCIRDRLKIKLKIAFSFYQVATKVGSTYIVVFPSSVEATLDFLSFVNLELDGLGLPLACMRLGTFRDKLLFLMLAPLGVLLLFKAIGWVRHDRAAVRKEVSARETRTPGRRTTRTSHMRVSLKHSTYKALPMMLRVTFLAFPAVSSLAFKAFRCDDLDDNDELPGPAVMSADLSVVCWDEHGVHTEEYVRIVQLGWLGIVLFPICVPFLSLIHI